MEAVFVKAEDLVFRDNKKEHSCAAGKKNRIILKVTGKGKAPMGLKDVVIFSPKKDFIKKVAEKAKSGNAVAVALSKDAALNKSAISCLHAALVVDGKDSKIISFEPEFDGNTVVLSQKSGGFAFKRPEDGDIEIGKSIFISTKGEDDPIFKNIGL